MWCYTLFPKILNMSLTAGIVIVLVLLARLPLRKAPKIFSYALWAIVLFRLLCPISFSTEFSLLGVFHAPAVTNSSIAYIPADIVHTTNPQVDLPLPGVSKAINDTLPQGEEQTSADPLEAPMAIATLLWLGGIAAMLIYSVVSLLLLRRKLIGAVRLRENIYLADHISTPFVIGVIRPKIYLPSTLAEQEQSYIILHEQTHIRRLDHIVKLVAFLALTLHWFNPLVWVAFILSGKDMEMSCDEAVMKKMNGDIQADYSASLLSLATGRKIFAGAPLAFGEGDTKSRIKNVMNYKKPAFWIVIAATIVICVLAVCLLSNPLGSTDISTDDFLDFPYDTFGFNLSPKESMTYPEELNFTADRSEFNYSMTWGRPGIYVEVGLVAQDGTEYLDTVRGGSAVGTIDDIPAGTYQVIVRNSESNLYINREYLGDNESNWNISGAVAFGYVEEWQPQPEIEDQDDYFAALQAAEESINNEGIVVDDMGINEKTALAWMEAWFDMFKALSRDNMAYISDGAVDRLKVIKISKEGLPQAFVFSVTFSVRPTYPIASNAFWMAGNTGNSPGRDETWGQMSREVELRLGDDGRYHFVSMGTGGVGNGNDYEDISQQAAESWELIGNADVNRDGLKETFYLDKSRMDSGPWVTLRVCDNSGNEIWSEDAGIPHVGWNSLFLCEQEGEYYLLRYHPTMYQGYCSCVYTLFTLEGAAEHVIRSNTIEFDVNGVNKLDAPKMIAFAEEVNALLGKSTLLLSSESGNYSFGPSSADQFFERYSWLDETPELYADVDDLETRLVKYSEYAVSNYRLHNNN